MTRYFPAISAAIIIILLIPSAADAVKWQPLTNTLRYQVALDSESVRLNSFGRLAVWLRFMPLGDTQRKAAAAEYGVKGYRLHLEHHEIDCTDQSAALGFIDIFGTTRARLKRLKGTAHAGALIPGSVLAKAAERVCPHIDDETIEEEPESPNPGVGNEIASTSEKQPDAETLQKIQGLIKRTVSEPASHEAWSLLGNAYFDADLPAEAIAAYGKALEINPDDTNVLNDQGAMYRQKSDFTNALANFEKAVRIDPNNLESLYNIGYVYAFDLNNIEKALQIWKRYLELDKNSETAQQVKSFVERYKNEKK